MQNNCSCQDKFEQINQNEAQLNESNETLSSQSKEQKQQAYNFNKQVKNILLDNKYVIIEFTDGTFIPARLLDDIFNNSNNTNIECQFCKTQASVENQLATLDNQHFICQNCIKQMMQLLLNNGAKIQLNYQAKNIS